MTRAQGARPFDERRVADAVPATEGGPRRPIHHWTLGTRRSRLNLER